MSSVEYEVVTKVQFKEAITVNRVDCISIENINISV